MSEQSEVQLYLGRAHEMLRAAHHNLDGNFYASAVNRAYYAIFYATNALLASENVSRSKHSGVIAAFRQYFVKPGHFDVEYSRIYERVMNDRHIGDYAVTESIAPQQADVDLKDAQRFVARIERYLKEAGKV